MLGLADRPGLGEVLGGACPLDEAIVEAGKLLAALAIAARGALHETAMFVAQADREAVELGFGRVDHGSVAAEALAQAPRVAVNTVADRIAPRRQRMIAAQLRSFRLRAAVSAMAREVLPSRVEVANPLSPRPALSTAGPAT